MRKVIVKQILISKPLTPGPSPLSTGERGADRPGKDNPPPLSPEYRGEQQRFIVKAKH